MAHVPLACNASGKGTAQMNANRIAFMACIGILLREGRNQALDLLPRAAARARLPGRAAAGRRPGLRGPGSHGAARLKTGLRLGRPLPDARPGVVACSPAPGFLVPIPAQPPRCGAPAERRGGHPAGSRAEPRRAGRAPVRAAPAPVPVVTVILVGGEVLLDLPVGLPHPPAEALDLAAQRATEGGEIRLHAAPRRLRPRAPPWRPPEPARRCAAAGRGRRRSRSGGGGGGGGPSARDPRWRGWREPLQHHGEGRPVPGAAARGARSPAPLQPRPAAATGKGARAGLGCGREGWGLWLRDREPPTPTAAGSPPAQAPARPGAALSPATRSSPGV